MHTTNLQSLIANNTRLINMRASLVAICIEDAKEYRNKNEESYAVNCYAKADRQRAKLAKLVELQKVLKVELQAKFRDARIQSKIAKLVKVGFVYEAPKEDLPREIEAMLDGLITVFVPKKADSRLAAEVVAANAS